MSKKGKPRVAAVIDIGSNELKLVVGQAVKADISDETAENRANRNTINNANKTDTNRTDTNRTDATDRNGESNSYASVRYLENVSYPLGLGRDTFQTGKMSFEKADKACEIIKNFLQVAKGCGVRDITTVATTAVREATNMDYILDQIKIKTGLSVSVIDDLEEKHYIYKLLMRYMDVALRPTQPAIMVYIGAGNIGISVLSDGRIPFLQNIKVGSLRMGELFEDLEAYTNEFYRLTEEYLASFTDTLTEQLPSGIQHFIASGHEIGLIAELTGVDTSSTFFEIPRERFQALYDDIKHKTTDQIAADYDIDSDRADVLQPAACIYHNLLGFTTADRITAGRALPCDAILYEMLYPKTFAALNKQFSKNTLLSARTVARRYHVDERHYKQVYDYAMVIFDKMRKIHGLGIRDKLLLQTAAVLHDAGKYINTRNHSKHSFEIVSGSDIVGLNQMEIGIVALICQYHSRFTPSLRDPRYAQLSVNHRMRVSKLAAILRLADALDRSHTQKCASVAVKITDEALIVTVTTDANIALEQWSFNEKGRFFEEVFGIKAMVRTKRMI